MLKWIKSLLPMSEKQSIEHYLSQSSDLSDLERRMKQIDKWRRIGY